MKAYTMGIILFCMNNIIMCGLGLNSIENYIMEFIIIAGMTKLFYLCNKNLVLKFILYLFNVNTNKSIWNNDYDLYILLPWNFSLLFLTEYNINGDREYTNILNQFELYLQKKCVRISNFYFTSLIALLILYNSTTIIAGAFIITLVDILFYIEQYLEKYKIDFNIFKLEIIYYIIIFCYFIFNTWSSYCKLIILLQLILHILYIIEYNDQTFILTKVNVNQISSDFEVGILFSKRKIFYLNYLYIIFLCYCLL